MPTLNESQVNFLLEMLSNDRIAIPISLARIALSTLETLQAQKSQLEAARPGVSKALLSPAD